MKATVESKQMHKEGIHHLAGNIGNVLTLADWWFSKNLPNIIPAKSLLWQIY